MDTSGKVAFGAVFMFALGFTVAGLFALAAATHSPSADPHAMFLGICLGLTFTIVGVAIGAVAIYGFRKYQFQRGQQAANPASPWLWREDWAQGRAKSCTRSTMFQAWIFAIVWSLISMPALVFVPKAIAHQRLAIIGLIFPVCGIGLLIWAIRETLRWFEFGVTWFDMVSCPLVIGREFHGNIHARFPHGADHGIRLKLSCVNRVVTGSGKTETTNERILWREEKNVSPGELCPGPIGSLIPVSFGIPWNALQTDSSNPRNSILWLLEADADVPGIDYKDVFELPVFRTQETPASPGSETRSDNPACAAPIRPTVAVNVTPEGTQFFFPPARNKGFAMGVTTFAMLWSGVLTFIIFMHAPVIFPVVFGFFDLLLLIGAAQLWLGTSRIVIDSTHVRVQSGLLGGGKWREFPKSQILDIQAVIAAQQGGSTGTPYYDIRLLQTEHQNVTLGRTIRDKDEAEWLVSEMKKALQLRAAAATGAGRSN
ncbi:MAG: hypothetical protein ACXVK3_16690 [Candidatus Angelobacter sp.]